MLRFHDTGDGRIIYHRLWFPQGTIYLWGHLKGNVYKNNLYALGEFKTNIKENISNISAATHWKVEMNIQKCVDICINAQDERFEHLSSCE